MNIIAYGSLMNQKSLEKTLGRKANIIPVSIKGYRRIFNAPFGDYAFLNLKQDANSVIEIGMFSIYPKELIKFKERESGSILTKVSNDTYAFIWPDKLCRKLPVLQSYIEICLQGSKNLDIDFWKNTIRPKEIINDLQNPQYVP